MCAGYNKCVVSCAYDVTYGIYFNIRKLCVLFNSVLWFIFQWNTLPLRISTKKIVAGSIPAWHVFFLTQKSQFCKTNIDATKFLSRVLGIFVYCYSINTKTHSITRDLHIFLQVNHKYFSYLCSTSIDFIKFLNIYVVYTHLNTPLWVELVFEWLCTTLCSKNKCLRQLNFPIKPVLSKIQ